MVARRGQRAPRNAHGQHFLKSSSLVRRLIAGAAVSSRDLALDLGAGRGIITNELARTGARVKAVELDPRLAETLEKRFKGFSNVDVILEDIQSYCLPPEPFKVVSNLPFSTTTALLRRLLDADSRLETAQLIVQKGAALKRTRRRGNLMNVLAGPWFTLDMGETISRRCFAPPPGVDASVLRIVRRRQSLIEAEDRACFERVVIEAFKFAQAPVRRSLAGLLGRKRLKGTLGKLGLNGANALDLTIEDWAQLFTTLLQ